MSGLRDSNGDSTTPVEISEMHHSHQGKSRLDNLHEISYLDFLNKNTKSENQSQVGPEGTGLCIASSCAQSGDAVTFDKLSSVPCSGSLEELPLPSTPPAGCRPITKFFSIKSKANTVSDPTKDGQTAQPVCSKAKEKCPQSPPLVCSKAKEKGPQSPPLVCSKAKEKGPHSPPFVCSKAKEKGPQSPPFVVSAVVHSEPSKSFLSPRSRGKTQDHRPRLCPSNAVVADDKLDWRIVQICQTAVDSTPKNSTPDPAQANQPDTPAAKKFFPLFHRTHNVSPSIHNNVASSQDTKSPHMGGTMGAHDGDKDTCARDLANCELQQHDGETIPGEAKKPLKRKASKCVLTSKPADSAGDTPSLHPEEIFRPAKRYWKSSESSHEDSRPTKKTKSHHVDSYLSTSVKVKGSSKLNAHKSQSCQPPCEVPGMSEQPRRSRRTRRSEPPPINGGNEMSESVGEPEKMPPPVSGGKKMSESVTESEEMPTRRSPIRVRFTRIKHLWSIQRLSGGKVHKQSGIERARSLVQRAKKSSQRTHEMASPEEVHSRRRVHASRQPQPDGAAATSQLTNVPVASIFLKAKNCPRSFSAEQQKRRREFLLSRASPMPRVSPQSGLISTTEVPPTHTRQMSVDNVNAPDVWKLPSGVLSTLKIRPSDWWTQKTVLKFGNSDSINGFRCDAHSKVCRQNSCDFPSKCALQAPNFEQKSQDALRSDAPATTSPCPTACGADEEIWTVTHAPRHSNDFLGNAKVVARVRSWLLEWKRLTALELRRLRREQPTPAKTRTAEWWASDDSDFEGSDEAVEDTALCNMALLFGPHGVGKTALVYALAQELGYKVLEVNTSSCRSGKQVLCQLQEATQSQRVTRPQPYHVAETTSEDRSVEPAQLSKLSLILFDEADLVFEEDRNFYCAVQTLAGSAKRPIILTTTESNLGSTLQTENFESYQLDRPSMDMLVSYLQRVSAVQNVTMTTEELRAVVNECDADVRKCLLKLQWQAKSCENVRGLVTPCVPPPSHAGLCSLAPTVCISEDQDVMRHEATSERSVTCGSQSGPKAVAPAPVQSEGIDRPLTLRLIGRVLEERSLVDGTLLAGRQSTDRPEACLRPGLEDKWPQEESEQRWDASSSVSRDSAALVSYYSLRKTSLSPEMLHATVPPTPRDSRHQRLQHTDSMVRDVRRALSEHSLGLSCRALRLDYLPVLTSMCLSEQERQRLQSKRRFFHYLDSIITELNGGVNSLLLSSLVRAEGGKGPC